MRTTTIARLVLAAALALAAPPAGTAADAPGPPLRVGTNISAVSDWGAEWPFADIMKHARRWITHNEAHVSGGVNAWDTDVLDQIPCDAQGYPLELPLAVAGQETTQVVRTVWAHTAALPAGVYTVLYDGQGVLDAGFDAQVVSSGPGRLELEVTPGVGNIMSLEILQSQAIRFMDWGRTNNSTLQYWADRPQVDDYTYTLDGTPYEWWIELCNLKQADAWVCVPHLADDDYIANMAAMFRDGLDPGLKVYVEYSNELWNWMFTQAQHCVDNGDQSVPWPERIVPFIHNALDIWTQAFTGAGERLVRVVGVQHAWQDVSNRIVFTMPEGSFDAFSPAAYFGFSTEGVAALEALGEAATAADVLYWGRQGLRSDSMPWWRQQKESIADPLGIPMIYYEGGQHLTPTPFGTDQPYGQALVDAQTDPGMFDLYTEWLDSLRTLTPDTDESLLMNFSFIAPQSAVYGTWGLLQHQYDEQAPYRDIAPKYQAVIDHIALGGLAAPTADFVAAPLAGPPPLAVQFTDLSVSGDSPLAAWTWDFGDGAESSERHPLHVYERIGAHDVRLVVRDSATLGAALTRAALVTVSGVVADFTADAVAGYHPFEVAFSDASEAFATSLTSWSWDFGDGAVAGEPSPTHRFEEPGDYTVSLAVTGADGSSDTITREAFIHVGDNFLFADGFTSGTPGEALPAPWRPDPGGISSAGAYLQEVGLSFGSVGTGGAAAFPMQTELSSADSVFTLEIGPGGGEVVTFYLSFLVQPQVNPDGGWGDQPVCVGLQNSAENYRPGVWLGLVQCMEDGDLRGRDFAAVGLSARPSYGYGASEVFPWVEGGQLEDGQTLWMLARYRIINHATAADSMTADVLVVPEGGTLPTQEPEIWSFSAAGPAIWPLGGAGYTFDTIYLNRDNTDCSAVFDEIRLARTFAGALPEGGGAAAAIELPTVFAGFPNHPNPFNPRTVLRFDLPSALPVSVEIYDARGRRVRTLLQGDLPAGSHQAVWDGCDDGGRPVVSGVYLSLVRAGRHEARGKMVLVR
jgi:PKD repeat protein